ncbi:MAG: WXG100 family type VII secretion target [Pseudonocardiales bacterium]|nr:WXG100 family type VII secretion target [Pseudonocardiales bacterium]MBV9029318.1 WXG100 family type VII secretion target [Pseudonocardiales bacterium]MBW0010206.1 WXG100 family type VII secretion target [Pseudonocardiales bacterium]
MSDGTILVTFGELESARSSIQATWTSISQEMEDLKRYLQPMVETWTGDASSAYQAHQAKWDRSARDLNQVLNQIGVALGTSNENYQAGEAANRARWS